MSILSNITNRSLNIEVDRQTETDQSQRKRPRTEREKNMPVKRARFALSTHSDSLIPTEMLLKIVSYADMRTRLNMCEANKQLKRDIETSPFTVLSCETASSLIFHSRFFEKSDEYKSRICAQIRKLHYILRPSEDGNNFRSREFDNLYQFLLQAAKIEKLTVIIHQGPASIGRQLWGIASAFKGKTLHLKIFTRSQYAFSFQKPGFVSKTAAKAIEVKTSFFAPYAKFAQEKKGIPKDACHLLTPRDLYKRALLDKPGNVWFTRAAQAGNLKAQYELGITYCQSKDYEKAFTWLEKAATQGDHKAQYRLGRLYYRGLGVKKDNAEAREWYKKAFAQVGPNTLYTEGKIAEKRQNYDAASLFYTAGAQRNHAKSQYALGWVYETRGATPRYIKMAIQLYKLSARQGNIQAALALARLRQST